MSTAGNTDWTRVFETVASRGALEPIDLHFARLVERRSRTAGAGVAALTAALLSHQRSHGHSCIDPADWAGHPFPADAPLPPLPDRATWARALDASGLLGDGSSPKPLVRDGAGRLYLSRYWYAEQRLARRLIERLEAALPKVDTVALAKLFRALFPAPADGAIDRQAVAAAAVLGNAVTLISGGPGTGKTTTVGRVLALLLAAEPNLRIGLAAPTGKAAARLGEAVGEQAERLPIEASLRERLPRDASTLHRLLGYQPSNDRFTHHAGRPLALDVLVIDEVSMVDLLLMDATFDAVPAGARVILLGDKDQLTSVETGSVFGDLCAAASLDGTYSESFGALFRRLSGVNLPIRQEASALLDDAAVELSVSYRFRDRPGIRELAVAVRKGDAARALTVLGDAEPDDASRLEPTVDPGQILAPIEEPLDSYLASSSPAEALERLSRFRVLCAQRRGDWGVERLNLTIERALRARGVAVADLYYSGRPILITANDYQVQLVNGDLGVCWRQDGHLWAFFPTPGGEPRRLPLARLPAHETAWAMTVHKSQGSEFDRVLLILGDTDSRVLTRELLYTGATRAKHGVVIVASESIVRSTVARRSHRISGLTDALRRPARTAGAVPDPPATPAPEVPQDSESEGGGQMSLFGSSGLDVQ